MKKFLLLILFGVFVSMNTLNISFALNLAPNTPVVVETASSYSSNVVRAGDEALFNVVYDVTSDMGKTVIAQGTKVKAKIVSAKPRGRIGKSGKIQISQFYTNSINGEQVPLSGTVISSAKSKMPLSITLSVIIIPFFLLMQGKDTFIPKGAQYTLYTAAN